MLTVSNDVVTLGCRRPSFNSAISKLESQGSWALTRLAGRTTNSNTVISLDYISRWSTKIFAVESSGLQSVPIVLRLVTTSVIKAKVIRKGKFRPPVHGSKTPERILMKPRIYNYVAGMTTHANLYSDATMCVVSANTWHVTCFGVLFDLFFLSFSMVEIALRHRRRPILTAYTSYVLPRKDVRLGGSLLPRPI